MKTSDTLATVFFVGAGALAATTVVLFALNAGSGKADTQASADSRSVPQPRMTLAVSPAGLQMRGQF